MPEIVPEEQALHPAEQEADSPDIAEEAASPQVGPELHEQPETLMGYMAENVRLDIREFMQNSGINGYSPEAVRDSIMGVPDRIQGGQSAAEAHAGEQEQVPAPDQQQAESPVEAPVPLNVHINSLEIDGNTRAFATAEYGDLTIRRLRVKEDGYGALSVAMPKFREPGGWTETCRFGTVEARNRLTAAVLEAYQQQLAQLQGLEQSQEQSCADIPAPGSMKRSPGETPGTSQKSVESFLFLSCQLDREQVNVHVMGVLLPPIQPMSLFPVPNPPLALQAVFFIVVLIAVSVFDIRKRTIPNSVCALITLAGLISFSPARLFGILTALPLLIAALFQEGGIGGGDIKLTAAAGFVLGFAPELAGLCAGLAATLLFYAGSRVTGRCWKNRSEASLPLAPFLSIGFGVMYFMNLRGL